MPGAEAKDLSHLPVEVIAGEITNISIGLAKRKLLPEGIYLLILGSAKYRKEKLWVDFKDANPTLRIDKAEWAIGYDPYSGSNLAQTALYQNNDPDNTKNEQFPQPDTSEFDHFVRRMGGLGSLIKEIEKRHQWSGVKATLEEIDRKMDDDPRLLTPSYTKF